MALLRAGGGIGCLLRTASFVGARRLSSTSLLLCAPAALRRLSTASSNPQLSSDSELLSLLNKAIKRAAGCLRPKNVDEAPHCFPFMIHDGSGSQIIILTRDYEDEHIVVQVKIPVFMNENGEGEEDNEDENNDEETEDEEEYILDPLHSSVGMVVIVSKDSGANLTFSCTVYPDEIVINDMTARSAGANDIEMYYEGPKFIDLDENLRKGFLTYLEMRGITVQAAHFLFNYMFTKDRGEYHLWLTKVKDFMRPQQDHFVPYKINSKMGEDTGPPAAASASLSLASALRRGTGPVLGAAALLRRTSALLCYTGPGAGDRASALLRCTGLAAGAGVRVSAILCRTRSPPYFIYAPPNFIPLGFGLDEEPPCYFAAPLLYSYKSAGYMGVVRCFETDSDPDDYSVI